MVYGTCMYIYTHIHIYVCVYIKLVHQTYDMRDELTRKIMGLSYQNSGVNH